MKEDFLHYVWKFQKFNKKELETKTGGVLKIIAPGNHNFNSGPDFFNAKLSLNEQLWAGNVEVHVNASDWYTHNHQNDSAYDNVILHVVWKHEADIFRRDSSIIPTLELQGIIKAQTLVGYRKLFSEKNKWIYCENEIAKVDRFKLNNWLERLYFERLESKSEVILKELTSLKNHWESLLFRMLCKNFGLKVNRDSFLSLARSVDFSVVQKCSRHPLELEALFFGQSGLLGGTWEDEYFNQLKEHYGFLRHKFNLDNSTVIAPKFFRLRPPNFPTIRLSQLAVLYGKHRSLFSEVISRKEPKEFYELFDIVASDYWDKHYNFGTSSVKREKVLNKKFIDLLLINTIIPIKFCYGKHLGKNWGEVLIELATTISKEDNGIIRKFGELGVEAENVFESQALLQLKANYCDKKRCLHCAVGNVILKG